MADLEIATPCCGLPMSQAEWDECAADEENRSCSICGEPIETGGPHMTRQKYQIQGQIDDEDATIAEVQRALETLPRTAGSLDGDEPLADNVKRAGFALHAMRAYADTVSNHSEPFETVVKDFLNDLRHLLDLYKDEVHMEVEELASGGAYHYDAEIRGVF